MKTREFRQPTRTGKTQRWLVTIDGASVMLQHGVVDGKLTNPTVQEFSGLVNAGKANEKSPEQRAEEFAERQILLKTRRGYREVNYKTGEFLEEIAASVMDFDNLPENLRFYKPQNSMNVTMQKKMDSMEAWWVRKRNGVMAIFAVGTDGGIKVYSSTLQQTHKDEDIPLAERYDHIIANLRELNLPPKTILLGEICCIAASGFVDDEQLDRDDLLYVNSVRGSLTEESRRVQQEHGLIGFCIWDVAFWAGECWLQEKPYQERSARFIELCDNSQKPRFITFPEILTFYQDGGQVLAEVSSPNAQTYSFYAAEPPDKVALDFAVSKEWEGWVVLDPNSTYGDRSYNFRGKAERPKECCKLKPTKTADFIVRYDPDNGVGLRGKGKKKVGVGSVFCYLIDPRTNQEVKVGKCGGGLTDEQVTQFADPASYPMVWEIEFAEWTEDGSIQFPVFLRVRDDKDANECTVEQNPDWEEAYKCE
jgi:hypothetical protein